VITFDGGMTTMNFAEAAMLIQGSVCVYGKKVSMASAEKNVLAVATLQPWIIYINFEFLY
jgi:dienelactone hydrolase